MTNRRTTKGTSLAKGPIGLIGLGAAGALLIVLSLLPRVGGKTTRGYERTVATGHTRRVESGTPVAASDDRYGTTVQSH